MAPCAAQVSRAKKPKDSLALSSFTFSGNKVNNSSGVDGLKHRRYISLFAQVDFGRGFRIGDELFVSRMIFHEIKLDAVFNGAPHRSPKQFDGNVPGLLSLKFL
jgi:hypothetical protein